MVVAYKKLTLEKNALEDTLKASSNYDKDDVSETDASEVQKLLIPIMCHHFSFFFKCDNKDCVGKYYFFIATSKYFDITLHITNYH